MADRRAEREPLPVGAAVASTAPMGRPTRAPRVGRHVIVRPLAPDADAAALYAASHGQPAVEALWTYMPYGPFASEEAMHAWLLECADTDDPDFRVVTGAADSRPLGMASYLNRVSAHRRIELGHIWYRPSAQGTPVNTETVYLMLYECFERLAARRVEWKCDALNARSRAAALRLGFRFEGIFRQYMITKGRNRDVAWFAMVDVDWPALRANLEDWLAADDPKPSLGERNAPLVAGFHDPLVPGPHR